MPNRGVPAAELEVLARLQHLKHATAGEIRDSMASYRPMAHGSVLTLLKRLESKSLVTRKKGRIGKAYVYRPARSAGTTYTNLLHRIVQRIFAGNSVLLMAALFENRAVDQDELKGLQELLDELRARAEQKKGR